MHQLVAELEQLIAADLSHQGVAAPIAAGMSGVAAYLAQDFVAAESLDTVVREHGAAPPGEALRVVAQVAEALDSAGAAGILHGCLHPRDVLISRDEARITGIGIAQALARIGVTAPVRRPYTAPERAAGFGWDRRADVFSLGALAYELMWAKRIAGAGREGLDAIEDEALRNVFAKALAEDPSDRFETTGEFAAVLTALLARSTHRAAETSSAPTAAVGAELASAPLLPLDGGGEETVTTPPPAPPHGPDLDDTIPDTTIEVEDADDTVPETPVAVQDVDDTVPETPLEPEDTDDTVPEIALRGVEAAETAPSIVEPLQPPPDPEFLPRLGSDPQLSSGSDPQLGSGSDPQLGARAPSLLIHPVGTPATSTPQGNWPIALALFVGVALGFSGGYWLGNVQREQESAPPLVVEAAPKPAPEPPVATPPPPAPEGTEVRLPPPAAVPPAPAISAAPPAKAATAPAGRLTIRSTPAGARVTVDGRDVGKTPVTIREIARGAHTVRLSRDGYRTEERRVTVTAAQPARTVNVPLTRAPARPAAPPAAPAPAAAAKQTGSLMVESRPSGATVLIDGKRVGITPLSIEEVASGSHAVRLELEGYQPWTSAVRVVVGEKNRVAASLER